MEKKKKKQQQQELPKQYTSPLAKILFCMYFLLAENNEQYKINFQGQLVQKLLGKYGKGYIRPVLNTSTITKVIYRLLIHELVYMVRFSFFFYQLISAKSFFAFQMWPTVYS